MLPLWSVSRPPFFADRKPINCKLTRIIRDACTCWNCWKKDFATLDFVHFLQTYKKSSERQIYVNTYATKVLLTLSWIMRKSLHYAYKLWRVGWVWTVTCQNATQAPKFKEINLGTKTKPLFLFHFISVCHNKKCTYVSIHPYFKMSSCVSN